MSLIRITSDLVKLDILLTGDVVDALVCVLKDKAYDLARGLCDRLKGIIPQLNF